MGDTDNLTEAIEAVETWDKRDQPMQHPFQKEFGSFGMETADAEDHLCERPAADPSASPLSPEPQARYGIYYGSLFRFKFGHEEGAVLGFFVETSQR